jgi:cell surface protein SprA
LLRRTHILLLVGSLSLLLSARFAYAQQTTEAKADTIKPYVSSTRPNYFPANRFGDPFAHRPSRSALYLKDPTKLELKITYDSGFHYTLQERIGMLNFRPATAMSFQEYDRYNDSQINKDYFQEQSLALDGQSAVSDRRLIPKLYISPVFDRIFGGTYVDITPSGFINLDFGGIWQAVDNPAVPIRQQRNGGFNFNQQISMNLVGQVGDKLKITANFDNNNTFDFQNNMRIEYTGYDEEIIKKIEIGNVSMATNNSLMTGSQALFGIKTELQFGKLFVTGILSRQQGRPETTCLSSGAGSLAGGFGSSGANSQGEQSSGGNRPFNIQASEYDENRHFFLGHYFRDNYEKWLANLPQVYSGINITRVEVYVLNRTNDTRTTRNFVSFMDMGEGRRLHRNSNALVGNGRGNVPNGNGANDLYRNLLANSGYRSSEAVTDLLIAQGLENSNDFVRVTTARRLDETEFTLNNELGYISLLRQLQNDEVLAVAYEYTVAGQVYKVGELTEDYNRLPEDQVIFLKMLRPNKINTRVPTWDLMMKNVYNLGGTQIERLGFELRIHYRDDATGIDNPSLHEGALTTNRPLIELMRLDRLNQNNDEQPDGNFDFIVPYTINDKNGTIFFPVLEPFGGHLRKFFDPVTEAGLVDKFVYDSLYRNTKINAKQDASRNKFWLLGKVAATRDNQISLPGFNIAPGSVTVTAGGLPLTEGRDYTVDYTFGTVRILNQSILDSGKEICISFEKADLFNFQTRWLSGMRFDYRFNEKFNIGSTILHLNERPGGITRYAIGNEPNKNTQVGFDLSWEDESRILTKMVDAIPLVSTKEKSTVTFNAEFAKIMPGTSNEVNGEATSYIDDFETAAIPISMMGWNGWKLASTPATRNNTLITNDPLGYNYRRAKIAWYTVDNSVFYRSGGNRPSHLTPEDLSNHYVRAVAPQEIFQQRDRTQVNLNEPILDIAYFPAERGPYNYNPNLTADGRFSNPRQNWAGMMRANLNNVDFTVSNIEYIEFWVMDPFITGPRGVVLDGSDNPTNNTTGGEIVFNLGSVSEDLIPDKRHGFENGLPSSGDPAGTVETPWGRVTSQQFLTKYFDNNANSRANQDIGMDGLNDAAEQEFFSDFVNTMGAMGPAREEILRDVSADNFRYYLNAEYDAKKANIVERYKNYNGMENNSPVNSGQTITPANSTLPDNEDINEDNTISDLEEYFEYRVRLRPGELEVNRGYIVDAVKDQSGEATWYLFRIPVRNNISAVFGNPNFQTIRFIRMYLTGWEQPVVLRMVKFQLVGSQWRKYPFSLRDPGLGEIPETGTSDFTVAVVNIEENGNASPGKSPYVIPPGMDRDIDNSTTLNRQINEQSLQVCIENLDDGDARAVYKEVNYDFLNYKRFRMFLHAEAYKDGVLNDDDVSAFLRFGTDLVDNYYEIEVPLKVTPPNLSGSSDNVRRLVWPLENEIDLNIAELMALKAARNRMGIEQTILYTGPSSNGQYKLTVRGNPDISTVLQLMIGVRNPEGGDELPKSMCIWANELRVTDFNVQNGWAANARLRAKLADLGTFNAATRYTSIGFGGIQQRISERARWETFQYDLSMNMNLEKFMYPEKTGLRVPFFASYENAKSTPQFDPINQDITLEAALRSFQTQAERDAYLDIVQDQTIRRSFNFSNVRKEKVNKDAKSRIYDVENFSFTYAYSDQTTSNVYTETYFRKTNAGGVTYDYRPIKVVWEPFNEVEALKSPYLQLFRDFNVAPLPSQFGFNANLNRTFSMTQLYNSQLTTENIDPYYERLFTFNRLYNFRWDFTKSLAFDYTARVNAVIDEPDDIITGDIDTRSERQFMWNQIANMGRMKNFDQTMNFTYRTPLQKIPFTDWLSADLKYTAGYTWTAGALNQRDSLGNFFGNILGNRRDRGVNGKIDMVKLYDKVTFLNGANAAKPGETSTGQGILKGFMMLRSVNVNYNIRETTTLTGFTPQAFLFGLDSGFQAPGLGFIFGDQNADIRFKAAENGWLSRSPFLTSPFNQTKGTDLAVRGNFEPFRDLTIQLDFAKTITNGYQEIFRFDTTLNRHVSLTPSRSGTYSISYLTINTAFEKRGANNFSPAFRDFERNIPIILERLNQANALGEYDTLSQDVLIPAFLTAYSGKDPRKTNTNPFPRIPLPNWRLDYSGLTRIPALGEIFASLVISHGYRSVYTVGNFTNSLRYSDNLTLDNNFVNYPKPTKVDTISNTLVPVYIINQVMISEQFVPLFGVNFRTKSNISVRLEYRKERNLSLNMSNAQITETLNNDVSFDFGYTKDKFKLPWKFQGRTYTLPNSITFRTSFTVRDSETIQRKIEGESLITNGAFTYQMRPTITYNINRQLDFTAYFERTVTEPKILSSFRRATTAFGFMLRFNLAS